MHQIYSGIIVSISRIIALAELTWHTTCPSNLIEYLPNIEWILKLLSFKFAHRCIEILAYFRLKKLENTEYFV